MSGFAGMQGSAFTEGPRQNIDTDLTQALGGVASVQRPSIQQMSVHLAKLVQQGVLTPEMAQTFLQQASAYNEIDPRDLSAQKEALSQLQQVADQKGMDPQAVNALYQAKQNQLSTERGSREAILQNAAARGLGGSGLELGAQLANEQGSATRGAAGGYQAAADAANRRMGAIQGVGQMGSSIYGQEAQAAAAQNAINQFNTANRQATENQNTGWRNQAQAQNLAEKQRISDTNTGLSNQQQLYNKNLYQQDFANQMAKANAFANTALGAAQTNLGVGQMKQAPSTAVESGMASKWSDEKLKKNVTSYKASDFLDKLKPVAFNYKNPSHGTGRQAGVMAQDMEKAIPSAVSKHPEGMKIDYGTVAGPALASLVNIHHRLKKVESKV